MENLFCNTAKLFFHLSLVLGLGVIASSKANGAWTQKEVIGDYVYGKSLALDRSNSPHIVYRDGSSYGDLKYENKINSDWKGETIETSIGSFGGVSIALTSLNEPRVTYDVSGAGLRFAARRNSSWDLETIDPAGGEYSSIKVDNMGNYHVSYIALKRLKYANWDGVRWTTTTVDNMTPCNWSSLALDQNNYPSISYNDSWTQDLKLARWNGTSWSTQTVKSVGNVGEQSSLALDSTGHPLISFIGQTGVELAKWDGTGWEFFTVDGGGSRYATSLAVDRFGTPIIVYKRNSWTFQAVLTPRGFSKSLINGDDLSAPAFALGSDGSGHIVQGFDGLHYSSNLGINPLLLSEITVKEKTTDSLKWTWGDGLQGETGYRVLRASDLAPLSGDLLPNTTFWTQTTGLGPNSLSQVVVEAFNGDGVISSASSDPFYTSVFIPDGLSVKSFVGQTIHLSWRPNGNPDGIIYRLERSVNGTNFFSAYEGTKTSVDVSGLTEGITHYFKILVQNGGQWIKTSDAALSFFLPVSVPAVPISDGGMITVGEHSIGTSWTASVGATGYTLAVSLKSDNPPQVVGFHETVDVHGEVTELSLNTTYYVFVKASNAGGSSDYALLGNVVTNAEKPGLALYKEGATTVRVMIDPKGNPAGTLYVVEAAKEGGAFEVLFTTTSLTPVVEGLDKGTTYRFRLEAQNHRGFLTEATDPLTSVTVPAGPMADGSMSVTESSVKAGWTAMAGAKTYTLAVSVKNANPPDVMKFLTTTDVKGEVAELALNTTYYLFVKASNDAGSSEYVSLGKAVTLARKPGLSLGAVGLTTVELTIDPKGNPAGTLYVVEAAKGEGAYEVLFTTTSLTPVVEGLEQGTNVNFRVRAMNLNGSPTDFAPAISVRLAPGEPARGDLLEVSHNAAKVKWDATTGAKIYKLVASPFADDLEKDSRILTTESTSGTFRDLRPNTTYYLFLQAMNDGGSSDYTSLGSTITLAVTPELQLGKSGLNSVSLIVEANGNPLGTVYETELSVDGGAFVLTVTTSSLHVVVNGLLPGIQYQFRARAKNFGGNVTDYSSSIIAETSKPTISNVDSARAYPVPFRPGTGVDSITFDQIPTNSTVRIYSVSGLLVKELRESSESVQWNVKNDSGEDVASGVYLVRVSGSGGDKSFKIMVQR